MLAGAPRFFFSYNPELPNPNFAKIIVLTANEEARDRLKLRLRERVEQGLAPEARVRASQLVVGPYTPWPIEFRVSGPDLERDRAIAAQVPAAMLKNPHTRQVLAALLERVSVPLKKADLLTIALHVLASVPYNRLPLLAKRHKLEIEKSSASPVELLARYVSRYDEIDLSRLLLEINLLEQEYQNGKDPDSDALLTTAKRYRVDAEKVQKAVAQEFAAKQKKRDKKPAPDKTAA